MRTNDEVTSDHIDFLEAELINSEVEIEELKGEIEGLRVELRRLMSDRNYCL